MNFRRKFGSSLTFFKKSSLSSLFHLSLSLLHFLLISLIFSLIFSSFFSFNFSLIFSLLFSSSSFLFASVWRVVCGLCCVWLCAWSWLWRVWCHRVYWQYAHMFPAYTVTFRIETRRAFWTYTRSLPLPAFTDTHTKHNTNATSHGDRQRKREERWRKRRGKRRDGRRKRKKNSVLTCTRGGMYMSVSLCSSFFSRENAIWNTRVPWCDVQSLWRSTMVSCFSASRSCFKHLFRFQARLDLFLKEVGREMWKWKSAWNSYEKKKNNTIVEGQKNFELHTSWTASVLDCVFHEEMSKQWHDSSYHSLYLVNLSNVSSREGHCGGNPLLGGSVRLSLLSPSITNDLHVGIATPPRIPLTLRFSSLVHHMSGPENTKTLYIYINIFIYEHKYLYTENICIVEHMLSWIVKDTTIFEMELCRCKQATAHAHVQSHCMWLNFEHTKNSNPSKNNFRDDEIRIRIC